MKKILVIALSSFAMNAFAVGTIAPDPAPVKPAAENVTTATCTLLKVPFFFVPSANVGVAYDCDTTSAAINTGNVKGKYTYGASTNGGSAKQCVTTATGDVSTSTGYKVAAPAVTGDGCS
ncbi:MAG: hypothetical protein WCB36_10775 [Burkholderiales bacterium]